MPMKNLQKRFQSFLLFSDLQWKRNSWDLNTYLEFDMFQTTFLIHALEKWYKQSRSVVFRMAGT